MGPAILPSHRFFGFFDARDTGYAVVAQIDVIDTSFAENRELIFGIRKTVFVVEQSVPEDIELDELDPDAQHVVIELFEHALPSGSNRAPSLQRLMAIDEVGCVPEADRPIRVH